MLNLVLVSSNCMEQTFIFELIFSETYCLKGTVCMRWTKCQIFQGKFAGMCGNSDFHVCCLFVAEQTSTNKTSTTEGLQVTVPSVVTSRVTTSTSTPPRSTSKSSTPSTSRPARSTSTTIRSTQTTTSTTRPTTFKSTLLKSRESK